MVLSSIVVVNPRPLLEPDQTDELTTLLVSQGAKVLQLPCLGFEALVPSDLSELLAEPYDWLVFTSASGIHFLARALERLGWTLSRLMDRSRVAVIGAGTERMLRTFGREADLVPQEFVAEGLLEALLREKGRRVLLPRAAKAREILVDGLQQRGWTVVDLAVYRSVPVRLDPVAVEQIRGADWVVFTSSSIVESYTANLGGTLPHQGVVTIGPITHKKALELGWSQAQQSPHSRLQGTVDYLCRLSGTSSSSPR